MKIIVEAIASLCAAGAAGNCSSAQSPRESDWYGTADQEAKRPARATETRPTKWPEREQPKRASEMLVSLYELSIEPNKWIGAAQ